MNQIIQEIEAPLIKSNTPQMNIGDTVKVFVKIVEGTKERIQGYEGVIIKRRGSGVGETITVRRVFQGIGIERVFLINSPRVEKITVQRRGHVRRAKLYYLRKRTGKATRIKEKLTGKKDRDLAAAVASAEKAVASIEKTAPAKVEQTAPAPAQAEQAAPAATDSAAETSAEA